MCRKKFIIVVSVVISLIFPCAALYAAACGPQPTGLVSWWTADRTANDWTGMNNGVLEGGLGYSPGKVGEALNFTSWGQGLHAAASPSLNLTSFTIMAWVYITTDQSMPIIEWNDGTGDAGAGVQAWYSPTPSKIYFNIKDTTGASHEVYTPDNSITVNAWNHVAASYGSATGAVKIHVNGVALADVVVAGITPQTSHDLYVGYRPGRVTFVGKIDEVQIFKQELATSRIQAVFAADNAGMCRRSETQQTGQTSSYSANDDGTLRTGIPWPDPRFTHEDGNAITSGSTGSVVKDQFTGLIWTRDGNAPGPGGCSPGVMKTWQAALTYVACLNTNAYLGHADWRLPDVVELDSLIHAGQASQAVWLNNLGFHNVQEDWYWSSTSYADATSFGWSINLNDGAVSIGLKTGGNYVWPVRAGECGSTGMCLPRTGQISGVSVGDDGDLQTGAAWPSPRFTNTDLTSTLTSSVAVDQLTGLMWTRDGNAPGPAGCAVSTAKTWQEALDHVACLNTNTYLGYTDWRLPSVRELQSLSDSGVSPAARLTEQGILNAQNAWYWSSTTVADLTNYGWIFYLADNSVNVGSKTGYNAVWPVRAGQSTAFVYLTITKDGTGTGQVTADPGAIIWSGSTGTASYGSGAPMTANLLAVPDSGSVFSGWSGDADCTDGTAVMTENRNCTAIFTIITPASGATLTPDVPSPQYVGNHTIMFTAGGIGVNGNYEYKFWLKTGGVWSAVQSYSPTKTWTWNTAGAAAGTYGVQVYVRNVGSSAKYETIKNNSYVLNPSPATGATLISNKPSPQTAGNSVTFTAGGVGGSGNYEYKFWLKNAGVWTPVQGYSSTTTWTWNTTGLPHGTYRAQVYVRNVGSSAKYEAVLGMGYVIK